MKRVLAAALCAILLLGLAPVVQRPARMITGAFVDASRYTAYVGNPITWTAFGFSGTASNIDPQFRVFRDMANLVTVLHPVVPYNGTASFTYAPNQVGKYYVGALLRNTGNNDTVYVTSVPVTIMHRPAPRKVSVEATSGAALKVTWSAVPGATGYEVWRATVKAGPYALVKTTAATGFLNTYLTPGKQYWYRVRSLNDVSNYLFNGTVASEILSAPAAGVPLAKATITSASATGKDRVKLVITPVAGATGYEIRVSATAGGTYRVLRTTTASTLTITGLKANTSYYFKVRAYKQIGTVKYYGPLGGYKGVRTLK